MGRKKIMERKPNILLPVPSIGEQRDLLREVLHLEMQNDMHTRIHSTRSAEYYMSNLLENNSVIIETIWVHYHFTYKQYCTITNELMVVLAYNFSANIEKIFLYHINIINTIDSVDLEHYKKYIFTSWDQLCILLCFKVSVQKPTLKNICGLFDWP